MSDQDMWVLNQENICHSTDKNSENAGTDQITAYGHNCNVRRHKDMTVWTFCKTCQWVMRLQERMYY